MFSERLKELRKERGLTKAELARELEVKNQNVIDWESGKCGTNIPTLIKIAAFFNVTVGQLVGSEHL